MAIQSGAIMPNIPGANMPNSDTTYLGHACVRDTYWYLSARPQLMEEAARRLDRRWEVKP